MPMAQKDTGVAGRGRLAHDPPRRPAGAVLGAGGSDPGYLAFAARSRRWRLLSLTFAFTAGLARARCERRCGIVEGMSDHHDRPSGARPLLILAMDHRESFGRTLFGVRGDAPSPAQIAAMGRAKLLIYRALSAARAALPAGQAGVLVDERYGQAVIDAAHRDDIALAVPVERSGRDQFELEFGHDWLTHLQHSDPDYAKVLVRDNPALPEAPRRAQLQQLHAVSEALHAAGVPLIYELLVPPTDQQRQAVGEDLEAFDRDLRPELVGQIIADNHDAGVEPALWKVEGLETADAARAVVTAARAGGRDNVAAIVLGRDAPPERLSHWLQVAAPIEGFVGFAIGRSIWEDAIAAHERGDLDDPSAVTAISQEYLRYVGIYFAASGTLG
jgi:myo-inositol catabolism protein IolC